MNECHGEEMRFGWDSVSKVLSKTDDHVALWAPLQLTCGILHVSVSFLVI